MVAKNDLKGTVKSATKWSAITNVLGKMIVPITNMILARLLTPDAFGVVATINIVVSFAELFADAGFQKYLIQHEFKNEKELSKSANVAFWTNFVISCIIWIVIFLFKDNLAQMVGSDGYGLQLSVASLAIPVVAFSSIQLSLYKRSFNFKGLFFPQLVRSLIPLIVTVPIAYFTRDCWSLIIGTLVSRVVEAVMLTIKSDWKIRLLYNFSILKEMFSFSMWTLFESLSIWLTTNIDIFIIGQILSSYYLGLYKTSITTVNQITMLITAIITPVLFSTLSRCQNEKETFNNVLYNFQKMSGIVLIPMSVGLFIYGDVVTWILLGSQWMDATILISSIGLFEAPMVLISYFASEVYRSQGEPKVSFAVQVIYICIIIPCIYYGSHQGFYVLCLIKVLLNIVFIIMHLIVLVTRYKIKITKIFKMIKEPIFASIIMGIVAIILHNQASSMFVKLLSIIPCIIVYLILCLLMPNTKKVVFDFLKREK